MVLNRKQFINRIAKMLKQSVKSVTDYEHPLWIAENCGPTHCEWFLCVSPIDLKFERKPEFWDWCDENMAGGIACFSSGEVEWWGFENKNDISIWLLRWSR